MRLGDWQWLRDILYDRGVTRPKARRAPYQKTPPGFSTGWGVKKRALRKRQ